MKPAAPTAFSGVIRAILDEHHANGVTEGDCGSCSSPCCTQGGFAIYENLPLIYARYQNGILKRADYNFDEGLSFRDFVFKHFDLTIRETGRGAEKREILLFHMKSISSEGHLITIPAVGEYYEVRSQLFSDNPWINQGCVFLSQKYPILTEEEADPDAEDETPRRCLLHDSKSGVQLTAKPIDCVFFTCSAPLEARIPSEKMSERWFRALAKDYPGSVEKYKTIAAES